MAVAVVNGRVKSVKKSGFTWYSGDAFRAVVWDTAEGEQERKSFSATKSVAGHVEPGATGEYFFSGRQLFAYRGEDGTEVFQWSNVNRNGSLLLFFAVTAWTIFLSTIGDTPGFAALVFVLAPVIFILDFYSRKAARDYFDGHAQSGKS